MKFDGNKSSLSEDSELAFEDLLPGDVLLHRALKPNVIQQKIIASTGSPYTHASIYLGDGKVAEASPPSIKKSEIPAAVKGCTCIGVLRSQCGFGGDRPSRLIEFIDELVKNGAKYDFIPTSPD